MPSATPAESGSKTFCLRFISGKYQGGVFPLRPNKEIVIGRSSDLDMVLVEDMVSRKHAKILTSEDRIIIQDLGSTNGTFVNGEKIKKARLQEGDRILIGTSILKLVSEAPPAEKERPLNEAEIRSMMEQVAAKKTRGTSSMSGRIEEVPLPDLLQLFTTSKKSGILSVRGDDHDGKFYLKNGRITYATIGDMPGIDPKKSFTRLLAWKEGFFEFLPPSEEQFPNEMDESTEGLLMNAMREMDELARIEQSCPRGSARFHLASPLSAELKALSPQQLDVLQAIHNHAQVQTVVDSSPLSDLETYEALINLIKKGYIEQDSQ